ncbi:MAG TPA: phosphatase PAP2 family protein [Ktedonobacteraceae bacterium]|nr:phosphatase PAP2 family protein [Ktedonobacteraceae bacterium]
MSTLVQINYSLFQAINAPAGSIPGFDTFMIFCANYLIFLWPIFLLIVWGMPFNWRRQPAQPGEVAVIQERRAVVLWVIVACLVAYAINLLIEQFVFEPRPFVTHKVHLLVSHAADSSFPSDHTAWSFAVIGMLLFAFIALRRSQKRSVPSTTPSSSFPPTFLRKPLVLLIVAFVIGCTIGVARIYVGVHYPDDILGGAIDGLLAALIVTFIRRWLWRPTNAVLRFAQTLRVA